MLSDAAIEFAMAIESDVYLTARALVKEFGPVQAPLVAANRADVLIERGDVDGHRIWNDVLRAVRELIAADCGSGEQES
jgi:hypothetical protein